MLGAVALLLGGCLEVEEEWVFDAHGGGTYALSIRRDASLLARVAGIVGGEVLRRVEGRGVPLREPAIRDGLAGLEGVEVLEAGEKELPEGWRETAFRVRFRRIEDLLRWEVLGRRAVRIAGDGDGRIALRMEPLADLPVVDSLLALRSEREAGAAGAATRPEAPQEPGLRERLGISEEDGALLASMLLPRLEKVRLSFRVEVPGVLASVGGSEAPEGSHLARLDFRFGDLASGKDRTVRATWLPRSFDVSPLVEHAGEAAAAGP